MGEEQQQPPNLKQLWGPLGVSGQTQGHIISPHPRKFRNSDGLLSTRAQRHPCSAMALAGSGILLCFDGVPAFDGSTNVLCLMNNLPPLFPTCFSCSAHSIYTYLNSHLDLIKKSLPVGFLTVDLHVWPDFHGNRSPLTDLTLKGMVVGLTLSRGLNELALIYLATIQAIALGTRHILEVMQAAGHDITTLFLCGGLSKNPLFVQMHADITGKPVVLSKEVESVLVGAAILGACASGDFASIQEAMAKMGKIGRVVQPNHEHKRFYDKKYEVFLKLVEHQREYRSIMNSL